MNRKLHHTVMALSATATVFTALLLAGGPVPPSAQPVSGLMMSAAAADSSESAIGSATGADAPRVSASQRRHLRRSRAALALPYFSFAQGLRRNRS